MKIRVTEVRVYNVPGVLEPDIRDAIKRNAVEELDEFLCDIGDWTADSVETVSVEEIITRARRKGAVK